MELSYYEIKKELGMKYIDASTIGYTLPLSFYEISNIDVMLKSLVRDEVKVRISIDAIRLKSNLTTDKTIRFTKKIYFLYIFVFYRITFWSFM